jgi:ATP-dependent Clp protease ATP-binding subunit ClpB
MFTPRNEATPLERYGHNLTRLAQQGAFTPLAGQEAVANRVFQVLSRKQKCCPMILDPNEHRRLAIMLEIVRQMASGEAGESFSQQQVIALDFEALFSNLSEDTLIRQQQRAQVLQQRKAFPSMWGNEGIEPSPSQLERWVDGAVVFERFRSVITAMRQAEESFILFIDHFHRLVGADDGIDTANLLVPVLARQQIALIGTCSLEQYRQYIERDAAFQRRFQEIVTPEARREYWPEREQIHKE